jgi:hypothetical protein
LEIGARRRRRRSEIAVDVRKQPELSEQRLQQRDLSRDIGRAQEAARRSMSMASIDCERALAHNFSTDLMSRNGVAHARQAFELITASQDGHALASIPRATASRARRRPLPPRPRRRPIPDDPADAANACAEGVRARSERRARTSAT